MIDVLATLCLLDAPEVCATRAVPVGAADCAAAQVAAEARIESWRDLYRVEDVRCGALDAPPMEFAEADPGLVVHRGQVALADAENGGDIGNVAFVVGEQAVAVIDAGGSPRPTVSIALRGEPALTIATTKASRHQAVTSSTAAQVRARAP